MSALNLFHIYQSSNGIVAMFEAVVDVINWTSISDEVDLRRKLPKV